MANEPGGRLTIRAGERADAARCEGILRELPNWFGIEESIVSYRRDIETLRTFVGCVGPRVVGFVTVKRHNESSAEIIVMAVAPEHHRRGVGRALVEEVERELRADGFDYLQVKTLGPSRPDENYAKTRRFYRAAGFRPLEEISHLWNEANPCLICVKKL